MGGDWVVQVAYDAGDITAWCCLVFAVVQFGYVEDDISLSYLGGVWVVPP